jgi:dTDP-3-amino-3,4,6-trideoxy-alpha-D-glucose transaminase
MSAVRVSPGALRVPFLDLASAHGEIKAGLLAEIGELIDSGAFLNGPHVSEFERAFAAFSGRSECVGVASGLDALRLGLLAAGLEPGEEVVVPANTFVATAEAVTQAGGRPVLADVSELDYNLDVKAAAGSITRRTRFLLPVHLYGQLADMRALGELAHRHQIEVLEDACQAHGAERDGLRAGAAGTAAAFSFYPSKNLGAMGDAGALVTDSAEIATSVRALREHGQVSKYRHERLGWTSRLDTIQALVLLHKLPLLEAANRRRRAAAAYYLDRLAGVGDLHLPPTAPRSNQVWYLFVVRTAHPDALARFLTDRGIGTGRHYPDPIHLTGAFRSLGYAQGAFPVSERLAREGLSLPLFPGITEEQLDAVVRGIHAYFAHG